jgi:hypothetical protein
MERKIMAVIMALGLIVGLGSSIKSALAEEPTLEDRVKALEDKVSSIEISGSVDAYYSLNFAHPTQSTSIFGNQGLRAFDVQADSFTLSLAELTIKKEASPIGFRVDLDFGPTADIVGSFEYGDAYECSTPTPDSTCNTTTGTEIFKNVLQAYVTYVAPVGKGLTIDFGKFVTHIGQEVIQSQGNWNYSRGILFTWAIPFYHAGLRVNYPVTDKVSTTLLLVNGWNNVTDNNSSKSVGAQVVVNVSPKVTFIQNAIWGNESSTGSSGYRRDVYDTIVSITPTDKLSLAVNGDYGRDAGPGATGGSQSSWYGLAGYGRYAFTDAVAAALRAEWFRDPDGYSTGTVQTLGEVTLTGEWKIAEAILTRLEYRRDWSNATVGPFINGSAPSDSQNTLELGVVYTF